MKNNEAKNKFICILCCKEYKTNKKPFCECGGKLHKILDLKGGSFSQGHFRGLYDLSHKN